MTAARLRPGTRVIIDADKATAFQAFVIFDYGTAVEAHRYGRLAPATYRASRVTLA